MQNLGKYFIIISLTILISSIIYRDKLSKIYNDFKPLISNYEDFLSYTSAYFYKNEILSKAKKEKKGSFPNEKIFSSKELKNFIGKQDASKIYLALLGLVFDVSKGKEHYGPGGGYEFFAGRDASRAFVSGDFTEAGLVDDVTGLTSQDYLGLEDWVKFYLKDYKFVGKLEGRFYDGNGKATEYNKMVQKWTKEAHASQNEDKRRKKIFPDCNSEWTPEKGSRVYCTRRSGGIERDWIGVPRKLFEPGGVSSRKERCACVRTSGSSSYGDSGPHGSDRGDLDHPNLKEYEGCHPLSESCQIPKK